MFVRGGYRALRKNVLDMKKNKSTRKDFDFIDFLR